MAQANVLTVATPNLENGRELDLLPQLAGRVADIGILFMGFPTAARLTIHLSC